MRGFSEVTCLWLEHATDTVKQKWYVAAYLHLDWGLLDYDTAFL
jgi:hypothetical protein